MGIHLAPELLTVYTRGHRALMEESLTALFYLAGEYTFFSYLNSSLSCTVSRVASLSVSACPLLSLPIPARNPAALH